MPESESIPICPASHWRQEESVRETVQKVSEHEWPVRKENVLFEIPEELPCEERNINIPEKETSGKGLYMNNL